MVELPEKCPICGGKIERGCFNAVGAGGGVAVGWQTPSKGWRTNGDIINRGFTKADFRAVRCNSCKIIVLSYEKEDLTCE